MVVDDQHVVAATGGIVARDGAARISNPLRKLVSLILLPRPREKTPYSPVAFSSRAEKGARRQRS